MARAAQGCVASLEAASPRRVSPGGGKPDNRVTSSKPGAVKRPVREKVGRPAEKCPGSDKRSQRQVPETPSRDKPAAKEPGSANEPLSARDELIAQAAKLALDKDKKLGKGGKADKKRKPRK